MNPVVIIGAVAAGMSAASQIKRQLPDIEVIVFGDEPYISYGACGMPFYVSGEIKDYNRLIVLTPDKAINERNINVKVLHRVVQINPSKKTVKVLNLQDKEEFEQPYEKLVIATGARAIVPPFENVTLKGIFTLKTLSDAIEMNRFIESEKPKKALIVGGGFIGVEAAEAYRKRGMSVTLVEAAPRILSIMDSSMSELVTEEMRRNQVDILTGKKITGFKGTHKVQKAVLEDGREIETDLVLLSIGVIPNSELAKEAGLNLGERNAILTDLFQKTSHPDIYAAGDCATVYNKLQNQFVYIPLALGANRQGRVCGENIAAEIKGKTLRRFPGILGSAMTKVFDFEVGKTGIGEMEIQRLGLKDMDFVEIKYFAKAGYYPERSKIWVRLYFIKQSQIITGGQIVGQNGSVLRLDVISAAIVQKMTLQDLYDLDLGYCPPFSPAWDPLLVAARAGMKED